MLSTTRSMWCVLQWFSTISNITFIAFLFVHACARIFFFFFFFFSKIVAFLIQACQLLSLEGTYAPAFQLALDMMKVRACDAICCSGRKCVNIIFYCFSFLPVQRLNTANDEIFDVLLSKNQVGDESKNIKQMFLCILQHIKPSHTYIHTHTHTHTHTSHSQTLTHIAAARPALRAQPGRGRHCRTVLAPLPRGSVQQQWPQSVLHCVQVLRVAQPQYAKEPQVLARCVRCGGVVIVVVAVVVIVVVIVVYCLLLFLIVCCLFVCLFVCCCSCGCGCGCCSCSCSCSYSFNTIIFSGEDCERYVRHFEQLFGSSDSQ